MTDLKKLQELAEQAANQKQALATVEKEVQGLELAQLEDVLKVARKGLTYLRIVTHYRVHNCNTCSHRPEKEFSQHKGVLIAVDDRGSNGDLPEGDVIKKHELWLLEDGRFLDCWKEGKTSNWQNAWWSWERDDFRTLTAQEILAEWGVDVILDGLQKALEARLAKLAERTREQKARLAKLKALRASDQKQIGAAAKVGPTKSILGQI